MNLPFQSTVLLPEATFRELRLRTIFECFKWDPQVEDSSVLAPFAIQIRQSAWSELSSLSEKLAAETISAESRILSDHKLLSTLNLPRKIEKILRRCTQIHSAPREMRFDFHFTSEGWRISEVNSDVPGGFIEAQGFTELMSEHLNLELTGRPATALAKALIASANCTRPVVGLVHATGYSDDRQVMLYLAREIERFGGSAVLLDPSQIEWTEHCALARCQWFNGELDCVYRFFPAEWLPNLRRTCGWENFFSHLHVPQCNPGAALVSQSKRFGLLCEELGDLTPTWKTLLPQTREVRGLGTRSREWVFKPALGRVGDGIGLADTTSEKDWREIRRDLFFSPGSWVAQRRFEMFPLSTPLGPQFVCLGVYTVDGVAAGIYARCSPSPLINHTARDLAVLLQNN
jgi:glutathionylspermidine synthase